MSERVKHLCNAAIVVGLALIVWLVPGGAATGNGVSNVLSIVLAAGLAFFAYRLYMEHRITLLDLPEDQRLLLYGSVTLALVTLLCTGRMWENAGPLVILWFALLGAAAAGLLSLVRRRNEY